MNLRVHIARLYYFVISSSSEAEMTALFSGRAAMMGHADQAAR